MTALWILLLLAGVGIPFTAHAADEPLAVIDGGRSAPRRSKRVWRDS